jgi:hypothetical protein
MPLGHDLKLIDCVDASDDRASRLERKIDQGCFRAFAVVFHNDTIAKELDSRKSAHTHRIGDSRETGAIDLAHMNGVVRFG